MKYEVKLSITFLYEIEAESADKAEEIAKNTCFGEIEDNGINYLDVDGVRELEDGKSTCNDEDEDPE